MSTSSTGQEAEVEVFRKNHLEGMDPRNPTHPVMVVGGKMTLYTVSPFQISSEQAISPANFYANPWPQKGVNVRNAVYAVELLGQEFGELVNRGESRT